MQDRYVGDVGDFGKYGLLRVITSACGPSARLGVVWYLVPEETHNQDGKHVTYLTTKAAEYRICDPELHDEMRALLVDPRGSVIPQRRLVSTIETSGILPRDTIYVRESLALQGKTARERDQSRDEWLARATQLTAKAEIVFVDPDNGIECRSVSPTSCKGPKYVTWKEVRAFAEHDKSVVIYHHLDRSGPSHQQVSRLLKRLSGELPTNYASTAVVFKKGTRRAYLLAAAPRHAAAFQQMIHRLQNSPWHQHFDFPTAP